MGDLKSECVKISTSGISTDTRHLYPQGSTRWHLRMVFGLDHYRVRI